MAFLFNIIHIFFCRPFIKSLIAGVLPGIALKIFLIVLPTVLMMMSKFEGFLSISALERRSAFRYYIFNFINVFLVSVIAGTAFQQLNSFLHDAPSKYALEHKPMCLFSSMIHYYC